MSDHQICIIGAGPRGLAVLERLCANERHAPSADRIVVHVVDPYSPGAGSVWRTDQSWHLLMNTVASQITVFTDDSVAIDGPIEPGPTLYEWAQSLALLGDPGSLLNLAASRTDGATEAFSGVSVSEARVLSELAPLRGTARALLELGRDWRSWALVDRDPVRQWSDGRVVLLGDAAHPMLHYAAQGASQALEDAVVFGAIIGTDPDRVPGRFSRFVEARCDRTGDVTLAARASIGLWHAAGEAAVERNEKLGAMRDSDLHQALAWMHGDTDFGLASVTSAVGVR
ncbi:Putative monooxygenase (salicylate/ hydroxybenzoate hydroxylase [Mycobacteroides abscessus subsp. abscessus]|nr:Putative monooxygenase (salicylate/ hydroxybenzoate hydroxylase [Mycobacteroides abscessus subsp. abscessus]